MPAVFAGPDTLTGKVSQVIAAPIGRGFLLHKVENTSCYFVRSEAEKVNMPNYLYISAYITMTVEWVHLQPCMQG